MLHETPQPFEASPVVKEGQVCRVVGTLTARDASPTARLVVAVSNAIEEFGVPAGVKVVIEPEGREG